MWAVALVVVVLVVVVAAFALVRRPRGEVSHSVTNYNHALGTLEHLSDRIGPPTVRPVRVMPTAGAGGSAERVVPPVPVRGTDEFPDPDAPIVFDDARPVERGLAVGAGPLTPVRIDRSDRSARAQRMALDSMNRRNRPATGILVAIVVVVVFGVLAVVGSQKSHNSAHTNSTSTTTHPSRSGGATTTSPKTTQTTRPTRPTPTTLPNQFVATTTSSDGTSATFTVPHTTYQITITGTGSCWVEVDSATTGKAVWVGELSAGTVQNVQAAGSTTVQFGTPTLTLQVDTIPVVLPTTLRTPFVATFMPSSVATPGAVPSGSTSSSAPPTSTTTTAAP
ncbi:MAG TPA: RodZ domain-containing protein [Acidimicrobiales bacterium]